MWIRRMEERGWDFFRKWPREEPISSTWRFRGFFACMVFLSTFSIFSIALGETQIIRVSNTVWTISIILAIVIPVCRWWGTNYSEVRDVFLVLFLYFLLTVTIRYVLHFFFGKSTPLAFPAFAFAQASMLAGFVGVFDNPVEPCPNHDPSRNNEYREYLKVHLDNWWRMGQFFLTFGVVIGASLLLNVVPDISSAPGMGAVTLLSAPFGLQISAVILYVRWKMKYIEEQLLDGVEQR